MTFIRLTRPDGRPIWLNASFIVTVEPRRDGGSVVVPVGDGLDYDVREAPEAVLSLLGDVAAPAVVPVPTTDALKTSSPAPEPEKKDAEEAPAPEPKAPARKTAAKKRTTRKAAAAKPAEATAAAAPAAPAAEAPAPESAVEEAAVQEAAAASELPDEEIERLRKLAPKSVRKLKNTLAAQFDAPDVMATIRSLEMRGVLAVERDHVNWK